MEEQLPTDPDAVASWARLHRKAKTRSDEQLLQALSAAFERSPGSEALAEQMLVLLQDDLPRCLSIWQHLRNAGGRPTDYACNRLIGACLKADRPDEAQVVLEWFCDEDAPRPQLRTEYEELRHKLAVHTRIALLQKAHPVVEWIRKEGTPSGPARLYNALTRTYSEVGMVEQARDLFNWMSNDEGPALRPTVGSVIALLDAYILAGRLDEAADIVRVWLLEKGVADPPHLIEKGLAYPSYLTNERAATRVICAYAQAGRSGDALTLFDGRLSHSFTSAADTCLYVIGEIIGSGRLDGVDMWFNWLQENTSLDLGDWQFRKTCAILMNAYVKSESVEGARCMFDSICNQGYAARRPHPAILQNLINVYAEAGRFDEVRAALQLSPKLQWIQKRDDSEMPPDTYTCLLLATSMAKAGYANETREQFERMCIQNELRPTESDCGELMQAYCVGGHVDEALALLAKMCQPDSLLPRPGELTCANLIIDLIRSGHPIEARRLFDWACTSDNLAIRLDHRRCVEIVAAFAREGYFNEALSMLRWLCEQSDPELRPNADSCIWMMDCVNRHPEAARVLFDWMGEQDDPRLRPNLETYYKALFAQAYHGHRDRAREVFDWMCRQTEPYFHPHVGTWIDLLIAMAAKSNIPDLAHSLLALVRQLNGPTLYLDENACIDLVIALSRKSATFGPQAAVFDWMYGNYRERKVELPSTTFCNHLIMAYATAGRPNDARAVFDWMCLQDSSMLRPNHITISTIRNL